MCVKIRRMNEVYTIHMKLVSEGIAKKIA